MHCWKLKKILKRRIDQEAKQMTQHIDFFKAECQTENISETIFGICDDEDSDIKTPAYVSYDPIQDNWIATVKNQSEHCLNFTAVDNCIEILRSDGSMDNRCDAMLTNKDNIIFVELKDQKECWIRHAVDEQLQTTIDHFKDNYDISQYKHKKAYACNRRHPNFHVSYKEKMSQFFSRNRIRLSLEATIIIK